MARLWLYATLAGNMCIVKVLVLRPSSSSLLTAVSALLAASLTWVGVLTMTGSVIVVRAPDPQAVVEKVAAAVESSVWTILLNGDSFTSDTAVSAVVVTAMKDELSCSIDRVSPP
jgi:hypothetical protein